MTLAQIHLRDADEIEKFYLQTTGMKPDYLQLSAGRAGMHMQVIDLEGVTLVWAEVNGRTRWCDQITGDGLHLGFAFESEGPVLVRGRELNGDEAQLWLPGEEMEYVLNGPVRSLEISVEQHLVETLGWRFQGEPLKRVGKRALTGLIRLCREAGANPRLPVHISRDRILTLLEKTLQPWTTCCPGERSLSGPTKNHGLVNATERYFDTLQSDEKLQVDDMANSLGVSRRMIFHAYRRTLGIGPRRYLELMRLQKLRSSLKSATPETTTVTREAARHGFFHPGRLPQIYRRQFGENPVETLNRV